MRWIGLVSALLLPTTSGFAQEEGTAGVRLGEPVVVEVLDENASPPREPQPELTLPNTSSPDGPFTVEGIGDNSAQTTEQQTVVQPQTANQERRETAPSARVRTDVQPERTATQRAAQRSGSPPAQSPPTASLPRQSDARPPDEQVSQEEALPSVAPAQADAEPADVESSAASTWSAIAIASSILLLLLFAGLAFAIWRMIRNGRVVPSSAPYRAQDGGDLPALLRPPKSQPSPPAALPPLGARGPEPEKPAPKAIPQTARPAVPRPQAGSDTPMFNYSLTAPRMVDPRKPEKA